MRKPRHARNAYSAELLADRRKNQIGMAGRQIARVAETEAGSKRASGRKGPDRMRHLIAARNGVVPWRLPHENPLRERVRDVQAIADIESEDQERETGDRHPDSPARDGIGREKDAAEKQGRTKILLNVEEDERETDTSQDRNHILGARQVDPSRPSRTTEHRAADFPEQFPPARKEPCEEQRQQQTDRLNRLHRAQIDLRAAGAGTRTKEDQKHRQRQRNDERQIAQPHESSGAEVDERHGRHHRNACNRSFGEPHERQAVA